MKTVYLTRDYDYRPHRKITVRFKAGVTYLHVIDAAALAIQRADAGAIMHPAHAELLTGEQAVDAAHVWKPRPFQGIRK
jgi:hypothetical protein